ncbi:MAG TPA: sodium:proton antiporter [Alphaproteobacteria bacterium]|nr:sodium:proton antiporter [Alphaproteobacteria bacterium]
MHGLHPLITDLMLITIYAAITTLIFKKLKQPMVLGYLLAGIFAGPYFHFVPTVSDRASLSLWADIGVIFLLFSLGLEFSFNKMVSVGKSALLTATLDIFLLLFCGYYTGLFLGWSTIDSFFLGSMISMSSTTIIIKAFDDLKIKKQKFTDLVFGVLVIEDIMGVLLLVLLPTIAIGKGFDGGAIGLSVLKLFIFLILCFITGIYIIPTVLKKLENFLNDEMLLLVSIALALSMVSLAVYSGFSSALGAFIMGSILSETGVIHRIENVIKPLKDLFGAVFFVTVGMMVDPEMFITYAYPILIITLVVLIGQVVFSTSGFVISGQNLKTAVQGGFSLAQVGEFAFIIASLGMSLKVLDPFVYPIIVAVSVITTFLTPIMINSAPKAYKFLDRILPQKWRDYIDQATKSEVTTMTEEKLWRALFKSYFIRIILFSLILYAIIALFSQVVRPFASLYLPNVPMRIILTGLVLLVMSPFLKGLIGWNLVVVDSINALLVKLHLRKAPPKDALPNCKENGNDENCLPSNQSLFKNVLKDNKETVKNLLISNERIAKIYAVLWYARPVNRLPLLVLTSFRLLLVMFFIMTAVHQFLTENTKMTFVLLMISLFIISRSKWLLDQYLKMEKQFLHNLNGEQPSTLDKGENS